MTIVGTRPELIRLSVILKKLDAYCDKHILVDTRQNKQYEMSDIFYQELGIRAADYSIRRTSSTSLGHQLGETFSQLEDIIKAEKPNKVLILGDTNTSLCALLVARMGIPVFHMEAGNRCFDDRVPEEINRKVIDAVSSYNMPYTEISKQNLLKYGFPKNKIFVTGNPIFEVIRYYEDKIDKSTIFKTLGIKTKQIKTSFVTSRKIANPGYILVTCHRSETVDSSERFTEIIDALVELSETHKIVYPIHPRSISNLNSWYTDATLYHKLKQAVTLCDPLGFIDFIALEKYATLILTDSGTVQEEACILKVPSVIMRDSMERPEVAESGGCMVAGVNCSNILSATKIMLDTQRDWNIPIGYSDYNVSDKVVQFLLGHQL